MNKQTKTTNFKPADLFTWIVAVLAISVLLNQCSPAHAHVADRYSSDTTSNTSEQWQIRHESALLQVENGSVLTYKEIMDLYYCTDVLIKFNAIGIGCAG